MGSGKRARRGDDPEDQGKTYIPRFHPEAEQELVEAVAAYEIRQEGLGLRFHQTVRRLIQRILDNPFLYPAASVDRRKATLDTFPYCIYYAVSKRHGIVVILSVHHAKRKPSRWQRRKAQWRP